MLTAPRWQAGGWRAERPSLATARRGDQLDLRGWGLHDGDVEFLAVGADLVGIRRLVLSGTDLGSGGVARLVAAGALDALDALLLDETLLDDAGVAALGRCHAATWRELQLGSNLIHGQALAALARQLGHLVVLGVGHNPIGADGARVLAAHARRLEVLDLTRAGLGKSALAVLADAGVLRRTHTLTLSGNPLGDDGAIALARVAGAFRTLDLSWTMLGVRGLDALLAAGVLGRARHANLRGNPLGTAGLTALATHPGPLPAVLRIDDGPPALIAALRARTRCEVAAAPAPGMVRTCPACVEPVRVDDASCGRCGGVLGDAPAAEHALAALAARPRRPCPRCARATARAACRCPHCARWIAPPPASPT